MKLPRLLLLIGVGAALAAPPAMIDKDSVKTFYRKFTRLTKEPMEVGRILSIACVGLPSPGEIEAQEKKSGPHLGSWVHYYANNEAVPTYRTQKYPFQIGSVIVKEKLAKDGTVAGVGGMRKREAGFDASHGDWEFFYTDAKTGFQIGSLKTCVECHSTAKAFDHVFTAARVLIEPKRKR